MNRRIFVLLTLYKNICISAGLYVVGRNLEYVKTLLKYTINRSYVVRLNISLSYLKVTLGKKKSCSLVQIVLLSDNSSHLL